jgi:hypothetical protein
VFTQTQISVTVMLGMTRPLQRVPAFVYLKICDGDWFSAPIFYRTLIVVWGMAHFIWGLRKTTSNIIAVYGCQRSWNNSVQRGANGWTAGVRFPAGVRNLSVLQSVPDEPQNPAFCQMGTSDSLQRMKLPERKASTEFKNGGAILRLLHTSWRGKGGSILRVIYGLHATSRYHLHILVRRVEKN